MIDANLNLPVMLMLACAVCGNRGYARGKNPLAARDLALAGGWGFLTLQPPMGLCPFHNPARVEFAARVVVQ